MNIILVWFDQRTGQHWILYSSFILLEYNFFYYYYFNVNANQYFKGGKTTFQTNRTSWIANELIQ